MQSFPEPADTLPPQGASEAERLVDEAILRSLCYADIFNFALTLDEIVRFAPGTKITTSEAAQRLSASTPLRAVVKQNGDLYYLLGREENCRLRLDREAESKRQLEIALRRLIPLQGIPFLKAAAITGALAAFNSPVGDDIDLLIIASRRRAWIAYFCLRLWRRFGHNPDICFNVFLTEGDLVFRNQNLFYAREILGAVPIFNTGAFEQFVEANPWIYDVFPSFSPDGERQSYKLPASPRWRKRQRLVEKILAGPVGDLLEFAVRKIQKKRLSKASPGASLGMRRHRIRLHKQDNRIPILDKYEQRAGVWLKRYRDAAEGKPVRPL